MDEHRKSITKCPLVGGGQGRSGAEVRESGMRIAWAFAAFLTATAIVMLLERVMR